VGISKVEILSFRDRYKSGTRSIGNSLIFTVELIKISDNDNIGSTIGWEKNEKQVLTPRIVDMSESMNSEKLAETAVSLNLKLMKWRIQPNINLDIVRNTKCLLLGSGTLGCNIARCLLVCLNFIYLKEILIKKKYIRLGMGCRKNNIC
jgi:ubiquitin-like modifier-activating enzyme ATG7